MLLYYKSNQIYSTREKLFQIQIIFLNTQSEQAHSLVIDVIIKMLPNIQTLFKYTHNAPN